MSKWISIVWSSRTEHYDSDYEYTTNVTTVHEATVTDWEEISDEEFDDLKGNWNTISGQLQKAAPKNFYPLLLVKSDLKHFDCVKALKNFLKEREDRIKAEREAAEKKKAETKAKRDAKKKAQELAEFQRLKGIFEQK